MIFSFKDKPFKKIDLQRLFALLVVLFTCGPAKAESIPVFGYPFQVERIESVDQNSVTITVLGSTRLVKRTELENEIVAVYLSRPDLYSIVELEEFSLFLEEALTKNKPEWVVSAIERALGTATLPEKLVLDLIDRLGDSPEGIAVFQRLVSHIGLENPQAKGVCAILLSLGKVDVDWVRTKAVRLLFRYQMPCEAFFTEQYLSALVAGDLELANQIIAIYGASYGVDGQGYRTVLTLSSKIDRLVDGLRASEVGATARTISTLSSDPQFKDSANAISTGLVERFVKVATTEQRYGDALELLTIHLPTGNASSSAVPLLQKILTAISADPDSISYMLPSQVQVMLRGYAFKDEEIRQQYQALLQQNIPKLLIADRFKEAAILFDQIRIIRPDPNVENDGLRQLFVEAFLRVGELESARRILSEIETGVPSGLRMRVLYESLRIGVAFILIMSVVAMILAMLLVYRIVKVSIASKAAKPATAAGNFGGRSPDDAKFDDEPLRKFVSASRAAGVKMPMDPYGEMLLLFGLKPGCTLQEIKVTYRNAVKECHPDLNPNATKSQTAKFIELTKAYERLVILHVQRTGER